MDVEVDGHDTTNKVGNEKDREEELDAYTEPGYERLDIDSIHNIFLTGMATFNINDDDIVDIYRTSSISMQARFELFQKQVDITRVIHGDANVRYGWLACSKEDLSTMMAHGLGHNALSSFNCLYGFGIHLTSITHPYACVSYCDVDENGVKHLVLCRVVMGKTELLRRGNNQIRPSGCEYDNGVDDIQSPKYYVVWNMNINTHIHPEFVVSFKAPLDAEGDVLENLVFEMPQVNAAGLLTNTRRVPRSPWLPFPMLFAAIRSRISPKQMLLIKAHYIELMAKKNSHDDFVMKLRLIVGDNILRSVVTNLEYKGP
ncbi:inactive poly [ADP-ribose] polymerase RCD1 [Lathyrus oleraceus]|nr:inactive poly [ADP-ribose] polymerase RCD1-like [Pisum sativum]